MHVFIAVGAKDHFGSLDYKIDALLIELAGPSYNVYTYNAGTRPYSNLETGLYRSCLDQNSWFEFE